MGAYTELVDFTFTANETSRSFTGLNITKDDFIKIVVTQVNGSASGAAIRCFPNTTASVSGFDTNTNYHHQLLEGEGSNANAGRSNENLLVFTPGSSQNYNLSFFKLSENGKANWFSNQFRTLDSSLRNRFFYMTSSNLTFNDPITSLTFTSSVTNGLGTGSRIQIYRLDAEKVRDITVTSNSTQVDIPVTGSLDPAITKDSEYLLVSYILSNSNSNRIQLFPNDLTTATNYHTQFIAGGGSNTVAGRTNDATIAFLENNFLSLLYTHIKLSEIGAFTTQNYEIRKQGTSGIELLNSFISSTSEAITSVTKLNVVSNQTNGIKSGTRFILYKLK
jgi:hypothetical protein